MHRIGCEYLMPAVIIAFPFIKVYSWKNIPPSVFGRYIFLFLWAVRSGARVRKVSLGSAPRADTRKSVCGAGFGEGLAAGNCSKTALFLQLRGRARAAGAETGCLGDSQNELRCKNNGIRRETARQVRSANGKLCGRRHAVKKVCEKRKLDGRGVFIFRLRLQNGAGGGMLARKIGGWRWKSRDGGGNRRTSAKKNTRDRCAVFPGGMQMGNARKGTRPPVQRRGRR